MAQSEKNEELSPDEDFPLHECVFKNDLQRVSQLIRVHDVSQKDVHGNFLTYTYFKQFIVLWL